MELTKEYFDEQLSQLTGKVVAMDTKIASIDTKIVAMDNRITTLDSNMDSRITTLESSIGGRIAKVTLEVANIKEDTAVMRENMPSKELVEKMYKVGDRLSTEVAGYRTEQVVAARRTENLEAWAKQVAPKVEIVFET